MIELLITAAALGVAVGLVAAGVITRRLTQRAESDGSVKQSP